MEELKKDRAVAKRKFTWKVKLFSECILREEPVKVKQDAYDEVCEAYNTVEAINTKMAKLLDSCNDDCDEKRGK